MIRRIADESDELGYSERSRYAAHLDRGWQLFDRGDFTAARSSAEHAEELSDRLPDACMLLAAICAAESELERALEWYEHAMARDPDYVQAPLAAAQLLLYDLDRPETALEYAETAHDAEDMLEAERLELGLLCVECHLVLGDLAQARTELEAAPGIQQLAALASTDPEGRNDALIELFGGRDEFELDSDEELEKEELADLESRAVTLLMRTARAWLDLDDPEAALPWAKALSQIGEQHADAWHVLAEAHFRAGASNASVHAAVQGFRLDARDGCPSWAPGAAEMHKQVLGLLRDCPEERIRGLMEDTPFIVLIHEAPSLELVLEGVDPRAPALSLSARGQRDGRDLTGLAVYRRNIARMCRGADDFETELQLALYGELAASLGLDDEARAQLGLPPRQPGADH